MEPRAASVLILSRIRSVSAYFLTTFGHLTTRGQRGLDSRREFTLQANKRSRFATPRRQWIQNGFGRAAGPRGRGSAPPWGLPCLEEAPSVVSSDQCAVLALSRKAGTHPGLLGPASRSGLAVWAVDACNSSCTPVAKLLGGRQPASKGVTGDIDDWATDCFFFPLRSRR